MNIKIGEKLIGEGHPCFIIAEAGVNHNGDFNLAKKLIDAAKSAGADAVKFQTFKAENVVSEKAEMAKYQEDNLKEEKSQQEMLRDYELEYSDFKKLKEYADDKGIIFLSTPHSQDALDFLDDLIPAYKIGSGDLTNIPFLKEVARKGKPVILSTGMSNMREIREAVESIEEENNKKIILLHCTSNYPCPPKEVNLRAMKTLEREFGYSIGYSDHTLGSTVPIAARSLGAVVLEKHFTLDKKMKGSDHKASMNPEELKEMIEKVRSVDIILGSSEKQPTESEKEIMGSVRKSIIAREDIPKGSLIKKDMIVIKRPGTGIKPSELQNIIGKKAVSDIKKDDLVKPEFIK